MREQARPPVSEPGIRSGSRKAATIPTWKWTAAKLILALLCVLGVATTSGQVSVYRVFEQLALARAGSTERFVAPRSPSTVDESCATWSSTGWQFMVVTWCWGRSRRWSHSTRQAAQSGDATGSWPVRRDISPTEDKFLWPNGVVPYVIDPGFNEEGLTSIQAAIDEWNSKTVISMVERTTESDFVRFLPNELLEGTCQAQVGRAGGEQSIWLGGPEGCGVSATIHEIGHAVWVVARAPEGGPRRIYCDPRYGDVRLSSICVRSGRTARRDRTTTPRSCTTEEFRRSLRGCAFCNTGCQPETSMEWPGCTEWLRRRPQSRRIPRAWRS